MEPGDQDDDGYPISTHNLQGHSGSAHSVSGDTEPEDVVDRLRAVVVEVTHGRYQPPARRKMGFV